MGYTFDKAGNRLTETILAGAVSVTTTYTYNEQNRLVSTVKRSGAETITDTYRFDNNGNIVSKTAETVKPVATSVSGGFSLEKSGQSTTSNVTNYKFDVWNQLVKTTVGKKTATYSYNAEGYRVSKTENERTTNYLYEADKVVLETDVEGNETARNIYGLNLLTRTAQNDTMNYMYNGHGDVTALVGENGAIQATYYYDAFGNITEQTGDVNNNITYAGYQYDKETDLYYLNARYYDSKTARFLSEDTYTGNTNDPLSLNLYTYCHNEPMMYVDPSGHWQESDKNLIQSARIAISQLTDIYVTTSDPEVKRACAAQAAAIRNCSANIAKTPQYSEVGMLYGQQLKKDGYVSASDWLKISNTYKKESTQNAIVGLKMAESPYVPSTYKNQAIKYTMNTVTAGVKKSTTQTKPKASSSPRVTSNVNGAGKTTPQISLVLGSVNTPSSGYTTLYRAVNQAEFDELMSTGKFDAGKNGLDVKFFAEKYNDAVTWGNKMNGAGNSRIIEVRIPNKTADNSEIFYRWEKLDSIGPARAAPVEEINNLDLKIIESNKKNDDDDNNNGTGSTGGGTGGTTSGMGFDFNGCYATATPMMGVETRVYVIGISDNGTPLVLGSTWLGAKRIYESKFPISGYEGNVPSFMVPALEGQLPPIQLPKVEINMPKVNIPIPAY